MTGWERFAGFRYFLGRRSRRTPTVLSIAGIAVGAATMIVVLAVMNGLQQGMLTNILEMDSYHLRVQPADDSVDEIGDAVPAELRDALLEVPGVESAARIADGQALILSESISPQAIRIRAIHPTDLPTDEALLAELNITDGSTALDTPNGVLMGRSLARSLLSDIGDVVSVLAVGSGMGSRDQVDLTIVGIFDSGFFSFDRTRVLVSLETGEQFGLDARDTVIGVKLTNRNRDARAAGEIRSAVPGAEVVSWREYNKSIYGALRMEKLLMIVLVGFVFLVIAGNVRSAMRRAVFERRTEIGVLKTMGASPGSIRRIFLIEGALIGGIGGALGVTGGVWLATNIDAVFGFVEGVAVLALRAWAIVSNSPTLSGSIDVGRHLFYSGDVPAVAMPIEAIGTFVAAIVSSTIAAVSASAPTLHIRPVEVFHSE